MDPAAVAAPAGQMAQIPHLFPHFNPSDATPRRRLVYHGSGVTASPVCSPSGWTKEYEIYGGVGFSGENAQIVASTARRVGGAACPNEGLGLIPPVRPRRRLLLMILFQGCGSQSLAPRQLGRHQSLFCPANRRERVAGGGGLWLWSAVLPGARYAGSGSPTGRPGGGGGGA